MCNNYCDKCGIVAGLDADIEYLEVENARLNEYANELLRQREEYIGLFEDLTHAYEAAIYHHLYPGCTSGATECHECRRLEREFETLVAKHASVEH